MAKYDPSKFLYVPPPADPLEAPRNKAIAWLDEIDAAYKAKKDLPRGLADKGDHYEVKVRSGNKLVEDLKIAADKIEAWIAHAKESYAAKHADHLFGEEATNKIGIVRTRKPMSEEARAKISAAQKARHAKK